MKCIITEKVIAGPSIHEAAIRIAHVNNEPPPRVVRSVRYFNTETSEEYLVLAGGFAWPGTKPGFAVAIAVTGDGDAPQFTVLAEAEAWGVEALIRASYNLYEKYGINCKQMPFLWYGDTESGYSTFIHRHNQELSKKASSMFFLTPSPHQGSTDAFPLYLQTIYQLVDEKKKRLHFGSGSKLPSYLRQLTRVSVHHGDEHAYPAIIALGSVMSALVTYTPWLVDLSYPVSHERDPWETHDMTDLFDEGLYGSRFDVISDM